jgi:hypothetical protein
MVFIRFDLSSRETCIAINKIHSNLISTLLLFSGDIFREFISSVPDPIQLTMTSKYQTDDSEFIGSLSSLENFITWQSLFKIGTEIDNYDTEEPQVS